MAKAGATMLPYILSTSACSARLPGHRAIEICGQAQVNPGVIDA
jgi:hypothetical protein